MWASAAFLTTSGRPRARRPGSIARELVREPEKLTKAGDGYCWLKGYAYMMRTESNRDLIAEIEGGIKKEVSVGLRGGAQ